MNFKKSFLICALVTNLLGCYNQIHAALPPFIQNTLTQAGVSFAAYMLGMKRIDPNIEQMAEKKALFRAFANHFLQRITFENHS